MTISTNTEDRIIFQSKYGVVYGIRDNDHFTVYEDGKKESVHEEDKTVKQAEKQNKSLIRAWEKYGKD